MLKAKDYFKNDLDIFINSEEFAEEHIVNKKLLKIVIDEEKLSERIQKDYDGLYIGDLLYFVKSKDYGKIPREGETQMLDGKLYTVFNARVSNCMYEIILTSNRSK